VGESHVSDGSASAVHSFTHAEGHQIHVVHDGHNDPLLLIMGLGGSSSMWTPLIPYLDDRLVIAFDAPGTGRSSTPMTAVTIPVLADIATRVLDHIGVDCADVLGYSYGGAIAQQLAVQHPSRVRRLILAATTMGVGSVPGNPDAMRELSSPMRYYSTELFERTAGEVYGGEVGRNAVLRERMAASRAKHPPSPYGYALQLLGGYGWTSRDFAETISQETLVISGDDDPLVPVVNARALADAIPRSRLIVLPRAGHLFLLDEPKRVGALITRFLARVGV
jgi:pimeloyl-ACP methyl ester carboxylesterase